ncbi:unnamed protein product [Ceratitis capitata]|uniref:(Mediterranean fruit fly) hypothetical protein n=1 Tax=Ceratitis capitata TaxID=7213 RepID=A0A811UQ52_CERCA|nr:unnamed protein product [Ceratitis capitata]
MSSPIETFVAKQETCAEDEPPVKIQPNTVSWDRRAFIEGVRRLEGPNVDLKNRRM